MIPVPQPDRTAPYQPFTETPVLKGKTKLGIHFTIRKRSDGRFGWSASGPGWSASGSGATRGQAGAELARAIANAGMP